MEWGKVYKREQATWFLYFSELFHLLLVKDERDVFEGLEHGEEYLLAAQRQPLVHPDLHRLLL